MNIGEMCTREVYVVNPGEPLLQAAEEMRQRNVGRIMVVEQRGNSLVPIGIVTDRHIVRALPEHPGNLGALPVADIMTRDPLALRENEFIVDAMVRLRQRGVRRAPVLTASGDLVGIVSARHLRGADRFARTPRGPADAQRRALIPQARSLNGTGTRICRYGPRAGQRASQSPADAACRRAPAARPSRSPDRRVVSPGAADQRG